MIKKVASLLLLLAVLFVIGGFVLPSDYALARSVVIDAPPEQVHAMVEDLESWGRWSPWLDSDPRFHTELGERTRGRGATQSWTSDAGSGVLELTYSDQHAGIEFRFQLDEMHPGWGVVRYQPLGGGKTKVTWELDGEMKGLSGPYFAMVMEKFTGPRFADGLRRLKSVVEAAAAESAAERLPR